MERSAELEDFIVGPRRVHGRCRKIFSVCCCCGITFLAVILTCILVRHFQRGALLTPMLDVINTADYCYDRATGTCAATLPPGDVRRFDLLREERPLFGFLFVQVANRSAETMRLVFCGAHVVISDPDASAYEFLIHRPGAHRRISSHASDEPQFGIPEGRVVRTLLVGRLENASWFQLEGSSWNPSQKPGASLGHVLDTIEYVITGRNVGPLGTSSHTDKEPLKLGLVQNATACSPDCPADADAIIQW